MTEETRTDEATGAVKASGAADDEAEASTIVAGSGTESGGTGESQEGGGQQGKGAGRPSPGSRRI